MTPPPAPDENTTRPDRFIATYAVGIALGVAIIVAVHAIDHPVLNAALRVLTTAAWIVGAWAAVRLYRGTLPPAQVRGWAIMFAIGCIFAAAFELTKVFGW